MKRTSAAALVVLFVIGAIGAALAQVGLASAGLPVIVIPITLPLALAGIGAIVISLALPIRRATRRTSDAAATRSSVDPFYATRVVTLAKACALSGALLAGFGAGALGYVLTRSATPPVGSIATTVAGLVGAAVLLVCGLVAEAMCRVPPGDDDDDDGDERPVRVRP